MGKTVRVPVGGGGGGWWQTKNNPCPYCGGTGLVPTNFVSTVMRGYPSGGGGGAGGPGAYGGGGGGGGSGVTYAVGGGGVYNVFWDSPQLSFDLQPPPLPVSVEAGELIGYRMWSVDGFELRSYSHDVHWNPGEPMTDKTRSGEQISDTDYVGVWAFKEMASVKQMVGLLGSENIVYGSVWLWGTVIEHEKGYRAQYAAIRSLDYYVSNSADEEGYDNRSILDRMVMSIFRLPPCNVLELLRKRYGVDNENVEEK